MSNVLNNGFGSETAADGVALYGSHVLYNGSTIANNVATDFGVSAAQTMYNHFATLTDDQGLRIWLMPKYIYAHPSMRWVIGETLRSEYKPFVATNEINVLNEETLTECYWAEITDTDSWHVFSDPESVGGLGLRIYNRQDFTTSKDFDVKNFTAISASRGRWSRGVIDWRQGYGSQGA